MDFIELIVKMNLMFHLIEKKWNLDLSAMSGNNTSTKRFDFVISNGIPVDAHIIYNIP